MKDIIITVSRIKTEITKIIICFSIAFLMNVYAIIKNKSEWRELFSQFHWVLILMAVMYLLTLIGLAVKTGFRKIIQKK